MTTFTVDEKEFLTWLEKTAYRFERMVRTMKNVAEIIKLETIPLTPLEFGGLEQSFEYVTLKRSPFIMLEVGFDAVDEKSGFHYARYQHDVIYTHQHPIRGEQFYLYKGISRAEDEILELIETDYLSLFEGGNVVRGKTNIDEGLHPRFVFFDLEDWIGS